MARRPLWQGRVYRRTVPSNAVFLNLFWFVTPFLLFFQSIRYSNHYDYRKTHFQKKMQQTIIILVPQKCISKHLISNGKIAFHKHFQCDCWLCNRVANFEIRAWVFGSANLISSSTFLSFRAFVLIRIRAEKTDSQRYMAATKTIFEKPVRTVVGLIHARLTRTEKMAFHEKYHVLIRFGFDWRFYPD